MLVRGVRRSVVSGKFNEWILSRIGTFLFQKITQVLWPNSPINPIDLKSNR
jgi:hypothetical protein